MRTTARRDGSDWVLNGSKMWITNASVADVAIVWARAEEGIIGFAVPTSTPFSAREMTHKLSLRASVTSEFSLDDVRLPDDAKLPGARGLSGPRACLSEARFGIVFGAVGAARDCMETTLEYVGTRQVFDKALAGYQLTQAKIADMAVELGKAQLLALHLGRLKDEGRSGRSRSASASSTTSGKPSRSRDSAGPCWGPTESPWSTR
jgi:glutaryl-CoA dehydrogenase